MSDNIHLAPEVDTTLLKTQFDVVTDAVGALIFPVKSNKFPPTFNLVRSLSYFFWFQFAHYFAICDFFIVWDLCFGNENNFIRFFHSSDTLGQLSQFFLQMIFPKFSCLDL